MNPGAISVGLSAAIVSVEGGQPFALVVTHDVSEAVYLGDTVFVMRVDSSELGPDLVEFRSNAVTA